MNYVVWFSVGIKVTAFCQSTQEGSTAGDPNRAAVSTFHHIVFQKALPTNFPYFVSTGSCERAPFLQI
jgi:hypothetical protein